MATIQANLGNTSIANFMLAGMKAAAPPVKPHYEAKDLYEKGGPKASDIKQGPIGDCWFLATLAAFANKRPDIIKNAIAYDPITSSFTVKIYRGEQLQKIIVTQEDIIDNKRRQGGSIMIYTGRESPAWPSIFEAAYAKMTDVNPRDGLDFGYGSLKGSQAKKAVQILTGSLGQDINFVKSVPRNEQAFTNSYGAIVITALGNGRPVTLSTKADHVIDGLHPSHAYTVEDIQKRGDDYVISLRNPWNHNIGVSEGTDRASAVMSFSLKALIRLGGVRNINVGPAR